MSTTRQSISRMLCRGFDLGGVPQPKTQRTVRLTVFLKATTTGHFARFTKSSSTTRIIESRQGHGLSISLMAAQCRTAVSLLS
jgi:hypothetical protein